MNNTEYTPDQQRSLDEQDNAFAQVWQQMRDLTNAQGAGRTLLCNENRNECRSYCYE